MKALIAMTLLATTLASAQIPKSAFDEMEQVATYVAPVEGGGAFSPDDIGDIALWLDASDASTVTLSGTSTVTQIADKSGFGRDATPLTTNESPTYITGAKNGLNAMYFDGVTDYMLHSVISCTNASYTYIFCLMPEGAISNHYISDDGLNPYIAVQGNTTLRHYDGANVYDTSATSMGGTWWIITYTQDATTRQFYQNLTQRLPASFTSTRPASFQSIMGRDTGTASTFCEGQLGEFILYTNILSEANRSNVINYLNAKWSIF